MRCQNPLCELSPPHKPPCVTQDGPMWFEERCAEVVDNSPRCDARSPQGVPCFHDPHAEDIPHAWEQTQWEGQAPHAPSADVGELRAELEELRASLRMRPDDERLKGDVAILVNQLQAARGAKGE